MPVRNSIVDGGEANCYQSDGLILKLHASDYGAGAAILAVRGAMRGD